MKHPTDLAIDIAKPRSSNYDIPLCIPNVFCIIKCLAGRGSERSMLIIIDIFSVGQCQCSLLYLLQPGMRVDSSQLLLFKLSVVFNYTALQENYRLHSEGPVRCSR